MAPTKDLKPPQELIDAVQQSEDMTAPAEFSTGDEFGKDIPRAIRNRLAHEEPQHLLSHVGGKGAEGEMSKLELEDHMREVRHMHYDKARHDRYDRNHPGIGRAGRGDEGISSAVLLNTGEADGHMRYGHD